MAVVRAERLVVTGVVQGVGFRPFVHRLANELGLSGRVGNDSASVFIEIAGSEEALEEFAVQLVDRAPPLASIEHIGRSPMDCVPDGGFRIAPSQPTGKQRTLVPPDTALCADCRSELFDPSDRRYRHPFLNCTNCGPRFTIIDDLPYDRPSTSMASFSMCDACESEYLNPSDRRFHAQPISCHDCGPVLRYWADRSDPVVGSEALASAVEALVAGKTVAVKGIGGFHLVCDASNDEAIARLRARKARPDKPFAVMVKDLDQARRLAHVTDAEAAQLSSPAAPIVLLRARPSPLTSDLVAPGNPLIGIMLPYTPTQHLLFHDGVGPLVVTSGNRGGEPIVFDDDQAAMRLSGLADAWLGHDRDIRMPCDDSVVRVVDGRVLPVRRARGYAPVPVPFRAPRRSAIGVGGELKNTFCFSSADHAWVSQHLGDMENVATIGAFESAVAQFREMYDVAPEIVAVDRHRGYKTTRWARSTRSEPILEVQHHHAHIASVMAEHQLDPETPVIGFAFDGTGYGDDGAIWGGELLVADANGYERRAHLAPMSLPGGDAAIRNPYRVALAHLYAAGIDWDDHLHPVRQLGEVERRVLRRQLESGVNCLPCTSMGRLFDAVSSLLGLRHRISYEAQAAIDLEVVATEANNVIGEYRFATRGPAFDPAPMLASIVDDLSAGHDVGAIAFSFHVAVADMVVKLARQARDRHHLDTVVLSGGVFQNVLLGSLCSTRLGAEKFTTLTNRIVPPNDGGLALGQAYIAAHRRETAADGSM